MSKPNLFILPWEKLLKNQQKKLKIKKKKQINALVALKPKEIKTRETKPNEYGSHFLNGLAKIRESYEPVDFFYIDYSFKDLRTLSVSFSKFKGPMHIFKSIYKGDITLENVEKEQIAYKKNLCRINQRDPKNKSPEQKRQ